MKIRTMTSADLDFAEQCIRREGWRGESREMMGVILAHDPRGCFIAEKAGRPMGMCANVAYESHGFIGLLIVTPDARGAFAGPRLLDRSVQYLQGKGISSIHLDGVASASPYYAAVGFKKVCASLRFVGSLPGRKHARVRPMEQDDLAQVCALDREAFSDDRSFFLGRKSALYPRFCKVWEEGGKVEGCILCHPGDGLVSVGPLVAAGGSDQALALLEGVALETDTLPLRIGILESNEEAVAMVRGLAGFTEQGHSYRMTLGEPRGLGVSKACFAVGSAAKG